MNSEFINSLGITKLEKDTKVVVAMSGGVDSSTVAGLMKEEGYKAGDSLGGKMFPTLYEEI